MKEFKGTPGPWVWKKSGSYYWLGEELETDSDYAIVDDGSACGEYGKIIYPKTPNAKLIAAAPELLEALRDMLSGWKYIREQHGDLYGVGWDRAQDKANAAIAKALGESK